MKKSKENEEVFQQEARSLMLDSIKLAGIRVRRALAQEEELNCLLELVKSEENLTQKEKTSLIGTLRELQLPSVRELSSIVSMLYDRASGSLVTDSAEPVIRVELTD